MSPLVQHFAGLALILLAPVGVASAGDNPLGLDRGLCAVLGDPTPVADLARSTQLTIFFQSADPAQVAAVRETAGRLGLLGTRVFADRGENQRIQLADNLADGILVGRPAKPWPTLNCCACCIPAPRPSSVLVD